MRKLRKLTKAKSAGVRFQPSTTRGLRSVHIRAGSYNPEARTFEFVLASETPCRSYRIDQRWNCVEVDEVLPMSALVGLDTFRGAPLLDTHSSWSVRDVLGRITALRVEGTELIASAFLSARDDVAGVASDIASGVLQEFSVGFDILEDGEPEDQESGVPLVRVRSWTVREGSLVPIPADSTAVIRSARARGRASIPRTEGSRAVDAEELNTKLTEIFAVTTKSIVDLLVEDVDGEETDDAAIEAEAEAAAQAARDAVLAKKGKTPATPPAADPARAAQPRPTGELTPAARAAQVLSLRNIAKRNGRGADFADAEAGGLSLEQLQNIALTAIRTSAAEIDTATQPAAPAKGIRMADTPAGKKLAKITK